VTSGSSILPALGSAGFQLRDLGYVEGQNIRFEFRSAEGQINRLAELAAELVRLKVDIRHLVHAHHSGGKASDPRNPNRDGERGNPVGTGLVASLPRPGGNVTGIAGVTAELSGKCIELIREMLPAPRDRSGQCGRSLLQTFPRTGPTCRRSHRNFGVNPSTVQRINRPFDGKRRRGIAARGAK
jgi:ABC transporter substrate binding protein